MGEIKASTIIGKKQTIIMPISCCRRKDMGNGCWRKEEQMKQLCSWVTSICILPCNDYSCFTEHFGPIGPSQRNTTRMQQFWFYFLFHYLTTCILLQTFLLIIYLAVERYTEYFKSRIIIFKWNQCTIIYKLCTLYNYMD